MKQKLQRIFISDNGIKFKEAKLTSVNAREIASKLGFGSGHEVVEL